MRKQNTVFVIGKLVAASVHLDQKTFHVAFLGALFM